MKKIIIWDVPIRVFHWGFALSCLGALAIGLFVDEESAVFPVHMLLGILACFLLVMRLALALVGSRYNRLRAIFFSPGETLRYLNGAVRGHATRYFGHNPGTAAAAIGMFIAAPFLLWTGIGPVNEELHEFFAYALLAFVAIHLAGLILYTLSQRDHIWLSMLNGRRPGPPERSLRSSYPVIGVVVLLITIVWLRGLFANYDAASKTVTLPVLNYTIQLGEHEHHRPGQAREHDDDDDD